MQLHFEWDPKKARSNLRKHKISFAEATAVFRDPLAMTMPDEDSEDEERWVAMGQVQNRRLVVVIHTWREEDSDAIHVRIISAREADAQETSDYEG